MRLGVAAVAAIVAVAGAIGAAMQDPAAAPPMLTAIAFDSSGTLYGVDARGSRVVEISLDGEKKAGAARIDVEDLSGALAELLGGEAERVRVLDLAAHPVSNALFLTATADNRATTLVRIAANGKLAKVDVSKSVKASAVLPANHRPLDVVVAGDALVVSGVFRDKTFLSQVYRVALPLKKDGVKASPVELFHVTHGAWETHAPLTAMAVTGAGKDALVFGATNCTPVTRMGAASLEPGAKVKMQTICELGAGNGPYALVPLEKDGKAELLCTTMIGETYRISNDVLVQKEAGKLDESALDRNGGSAPGIDVLKGWEQARQAAPLGAKWVAVVLGTSKQVSLKTLDRP